MARQCCRDSVAMKLIARPEAETEGYVTPCRWCDRHATYRAGRWVFSEDDPIADRHATSAALRMLCVARDGYCRIQKDCIWPVDGPRYTCDGESQWAHMHARRRSHTRGLDPVVRHDPRYSFMACAFHHSEYDAHRLIITALTRRGAEGRLKYRRAK